MCSMKYVVHVGYYVVLEYDEEWGDVWSGNLLNLLALVSKRDESIPGEFYPLSYENAYPLPWRVFV